MPDPEQIPTPDVAGQLPHHRAATITTEAPKASRPVPPAPPSLLNRILAWGGVAQIFVAEAVQFVERVRPGADGTTKKAAAIELAMDRLRELEASRDLLPAWLEPIALRAAGLTLGWMIDRTVAELTARGVLNEHHADR